MLASTIAAISTAPMKAGVAVIRVSGSRALPILQSVFTLPNGKTPDELAPRRAVYGHIRQDKQVLDDVLVTYFAAPHSYTGEDVVEISCHGGVVVSRMILALCLQNGAVLAQPGEFTRRAFTAGKLSLTRAEGISRLLEAKTEAAALLSSQTARGALSQHVEALSRELMRPVSSLYAAIDYPEEDMEELEDEQLALQVQGVKERIESLLQTQKTGMAVVEGVPALIVGKPNVGKSTLFNRFAGQERAIVTQIPGTTRDLLELEVKAGRLLLRLTDTAGLREDTEDPVEQIGISMVKERLQSCPFGVVLALFDRSRPLDEDDRRLMARLRELSLPVIPLITKCDLPAAWHKLPWEGEVFSVQAKEEELPEELIKKLEAIFIEDETALREGEILTDLRQAQQLRRAKEALDEALHALNGGLKDACGALLEEALAALYETDGRGVSERIVSEIFSRFCVGK